jgi:hypothetical protein
VFELDAFVMSTRACTSMPAGSRKIEPAAIRVRKSSKTMAAAVAFSDTVQREIARFQALKASPASA